MAFTTTLILRFPNNTALFCLETNTSDFATGAVIEQLRKDKFWHSFAFLSKSLNEHKCNYKVYNKELLTMIHTLKEYSHYLKGHSELVKTRSDHFNFTYFCQAQKLS